MKHLLIGLSTLTFCLSIAPCRAQDKPLAVVVMDPLAAPLSCPCVEGFAQRRYEKLGTYLEKQLHRPVKVLFADDLSKIVRGETGKNIDLVIGKQSLVKFDANLLSIPLRELAMLTDKEGKTTFTGLFVVLQDDPARRLQDLKGYTVLFGPPDCDEKFKAAADALQKAGVKLPAKLESRPGCSDSVLEMIEYWEKPTAAVISSYAASLLEGCGTIEKGAIRVVGETKPVPFVTVFAAQSMDASTAEKISRALDMVKSSPELLSALESKKGFIIIPGKSKSGRPVEKQGPAADGKETVDKKKVTAEDNAAWPGWRGPNRDGVVARLPPRLPERTKILWSKELTGVGLSGVAVSGKYVIVADRDAADTGDIFRCLDAAGGTELWSLEYFTRGAIKDYGNSPRGTPLIYDGKAYTLGGLGDLHCLNLADGRILWKKNLVLDFGGIVPTWGFCSSPLLADDKIIVNPGSPRAALVALDRHSGKEIWRSPGFPSAYASFIAGTFGGVRQIVGYDEKSLGGWDAATGRRLWTLVPPQTGDFNVPTPLDAGGKLLVSSENNGTRMYGFASGGVIRPEPLAENADLAPDTSTPVFAGGKVFGCWNALYCLNAGDGLKSLWTGEDEAFSSFPMLIASPERVLAISNRGELILVNASSDKFEVISRLRIFAEDTEVLSHPALVGDRLYIRGATKVVCVDLSAE
ncbi:MAG: PQQ-binding-like beta-propeller repeat protein [Pirellulales bacterium]|nr:PQQ-binding-like beta-propeller repeat protein [Pirellulales bacterium]